MKHLKIYENFGSELLNTVEDMLHSIRDNGVEAVLESNSKDNITVAIHLPVSDVLTHQTFTPNQIKDEMFMINDFLVENDYLPQMIFLYNINTKGLKGESEFIKFEDIDRVGDKEYTHMSFNWRLPVDYPWDK